MPAVGLALGLVIGSAGLAAQGASPDLAGSTRPSGQAAQVVLLGVPDLRWTDIDPARTPALAAFVSRAAVGALAVKATGLPTRPPGGWLTLGAGNRMAGVPLAGPVTAALDRARARNSTEPYGARAGALGLALRAAGATASASGGPGAAVAVAPADPPAAGTVADLSVVEDDRLYGTIGGRRQRAAAALDRDLAPLLDRARAAGSSPARTVVLAGISDGQGGGAALHVAAAAGPGLSPGALVSPSTRRAPYVQLIDLAPTVLAALGIPPAPSMAGNPWRSTSSRAEDRSPPALVSLDRQARAGLRWAGTFQTALVWAVLIWTVLALAALFPIGPLRLPAPRWVAIGYGVAALPVAAILLQLLPWWQAPAVGPAVLIAVPLAVAGLARIADRRRPGGGPIVVAGITVGVLGIDLVSGTHLQIAALLGDSPLIAGRFAGFGNLASALFVSCGVLLLGLTCGPRRAVLPAAVAGALGLVLLGAPQFGADAGGLLATTPALGVLLLRLAGRRIRLRTLAGLGLAAALLLGAAAAADYARPPEKQTHLGRFVGDLSHGGTGGTALRRHLDAAGHSLLASPFNLILLLVAGLAVIVVRGGLRPQLGAIRAVPGLADGLLAAGVAVTLGGLVNDSGIAVPGIAAVVLLPLAVGAGLAANAGGDGQGNAGVDRLGSEVSDAAAHSPASAIRPRSRLRGAKAATGLARYQT